MKQRLFITIVAFLFVSGAFASTNDITELVRKGLFEEEANHNLDAAMQAYQTAIGEFDQDRPLAATAVFRLGECYRKLGRTNEANAQYQRVLRDFPDQTQLVGLSRGYLPQNLASDARQTSAPDGITPEERDQLLKIQQTVRASPDLIQEGHLLWEAANKSWVAVARFLLDNGADPNKGDLKHGPPIYEAARDGDLEMVTLLLDRGAEGSDIALRIASNSGYRLLAQTLLLRHADPNLKDKNGDGALHFAALGGFASVAELLLHNGANINATNNAGRTPLFSAIEAKHAPMVALLLTNGATVNIRDATGVTPLKLASESEEIKKLLRNAGASDDYDRLGGIYVTLKGSGIIGGREFSKAKDPAEPHSVVEAVGRYYGVGWPDENVPYAPVVDFPDFGHMTIDRMAQGGARQEIAVNLDEVLKSGDCSKNISLQWGDVVEIPQMDHRLLEVWGGLGNPTEAAIQYCLQRQVDIVIKGQTNHIALVPRIFWPMHEPPRGNQSQLRVPARDLNFVVRNCDLLLLSSDLTRVKVTRADGSVREFNLETKPPPSFILRDGDVIEIPEK